MNFDTITKNSRAAKKPDTFYLTASCFYKMPTTLTVLIGRFYLEKEEAIHGTL